MIIRSKTDIPGPGRRKSKIIPAIQVRSVVLFPGQALTLQLNRPQNLTLINECLPSRQKVGIIFSPAGDDGEKGLDLCQIGCLARIISAKDGLGKSKSIVLEGIERIAVTGISKRRPFLKTSVYSIKEPDQIRKMDVALEKELGSIIEQISRINPTYAESLLNLLNLQIENIGRIADRIAATLHLPVEFKQELLETVEIQPRLINLKNFLAEYIDSNPNIFDYLNFDNYPEKEQPRLPYKESGKKIRRMVNEIDQTLIDEIETNKNLPDDIRARCIIELDRMKNLSPASAEFGTTRQFLDWLLSIPWNKYGEENYDLKAVEKIINKDYYGPDKVKKRILERVAIRKLSGRSDEASVLCISGPSGTGKASLGKAIARAMGKEFIRISVGSVDDIEDIKGTPRTIIGAMPGLIVRALKNCGSIDPVIFIENLDYLSEVGSSLLSMVLLEAIDPRHNSRFMDDYVGMPIDLSRVFFICSAKSLENIPEIFLPRLEIIELPGYIDKEKIHIAKKYIIPELLKKHGLLKKEVLFYEKGLLKIIRHYTLEAGLLNFKQKLELICRYIAKEKASNPRNKWAINETEVESLLGTQEYSPEKPGKKPEIGVATGLAWTGLGGDLMTIEALKMKGSGEVISTGSLGDVMKESIQAAHSYIRSKADILGIDHNDFDNFDIHVHFPSGAIPKDGPSAGVAVCLAIASVMAERPIPHDIAMTGEVTLRGKVLQVGGLTEKLSAAYRAGIPIVYIPKANEKDIKDLPGDIVKKTRFYFMETVDEIFSTGLEDFVPSSFTLEKLFAEEIEKVKTRKKRRTPSTIAAKPRRK